jgi:hypothetical protein
MMSFMDPVLVTPDKVDLFRNSMQGKEHMNFQAVDSRLGPALLSVKEISCQGGPKVRPAIDGGQ